MSAKFLHVLTDENPDLQRQIGCMTGIFQLFDRHHFINGHGSKRFPSGHSHVNNGNSRGDTCLQKSTERNLKKNMNDNRRVPMESSRASFSSSSCSSSFSSLDCNKTGQSESLSFDRLVLPEMPSRDLPVNHPTSSPWTRRQSVDLRDVVKDSIYRDVHGLSVKTKTKEEAVNHTMKYRDSPRPFHSPKSMDRIDFNGKAPCRFKEAREPPRISYEGRDGSVFRGPKDSPRFSYDGRERSRSSFESRDTFKGATKLRESPRMSLDSRDISMRGSNSDSKSNSIFNDPQKGDLNFNKISYQMQESDSFKRPHSVVAKLMGLEALPSSNSLTASPRRDPFSSSSKTTEVTTQNLICGSRRNSLKGPVSPWLRNSDSVIKPVTSSRFPIEPAPWKQQDRVHGFQKQAREAPARSSYFYPSVYSEIENRLKELEFKQSDKDLRALKQILEAMTKKEEDQISNSVPHKKYNIPNHTNLNRNPKLANKRTPQNIRQNSPLKTFESPIVIMKPTKFIPIDGLSGARKSRSVDSEYTKKGAISNRESKDLILKHSHRDTDNQSNNSKDNKNGRILQSGQTSDRPQPLRKENTVCFGRSTGSLSPRLQQKKLELDKRSRPTTPSSPGGKLGPKTKLQQIDDQLSEIMSRGDELSLCSDSNISSALQMDVEVTSVDRSDEINFTFFRHGTQSPSRKAVNNLVSSLEQKKPPPRMSEDGSNAELAAAIPEQPSPVSVLDDSFYREDLPSPVEKISIDLKGDGRKNSDENDLSHLFNSTKSYISSEMNRKKLENIEHLVQKLRRLNSSHNEATTDYIASLCEDSNPDHRYISEIMLASGFLLRDLGSGLGTIQLHSSGYPINPDLFCVLEQTKSKKYEEKVAKSKPDQEKLHRKLVFDAVNEILLGKLISERPSLNPWLRASKRFRRKLSAKQLLKDLSSEIEQLQSNKSPCNFEDDDSDGLKNILWEDVLHRSENWIDFHREVSGVVLDVERLIFKDLVDEIVSGESASLRGKPNRRCRQLFYK